MIDRRVGVVAFVVVTDQPERHQRDDATPVRSTCVASLWLRTVVDPAPRFDTFDRPAGLRVKDSDRNNESR